MITVRHLTKYFDGRPAVKDINAEYLPGQCSLVIGASGSGKTVLLKSIVGLLEPDEGDVLLNGTAFNHLSHTEKRKSAAGWECCFRAVLCSTSLQLWKMSCSLWISSQT